ncbi:MAG: DUF502 domain-containing protein [candidate division NC10 bacterium]|nr:DUF502 domain-containing protein [candidate division NC10 bacterium]
MKRPPPSAASWAARGKRSLLAGLVVVLPAALTLYILVFLFRVTGAAFAVPVEFLVRPFIGREVGGVVTTPIAALLTVVLLIGVGVSAQRFGRTAFRRAEEWVFRRLPVARGIHRAIRQLFDLLFAEGGAPRAVGLVEYPRPGMYALCFLTSRDPLVSVYLPTTPNPTSGFLLLVPREDVRSLDLGVEEAARIIVSGGSLPPPDRVLRVADVGARGEGGR